ncbi:MAG TPA: hypothetical protein VFT39_14440 [Vicinamibacterales bacterium]|nr:hypothetical protein [Vicinamibacterales bacterium]
MGIAARSRPARGNALSRVTRTPSDTRHRLAADQLVLLAIAALLILAGAMRREFLGDGVRHLPAILSSRIQPGEPRWLLFPPLANVWIRLLLAIGVAGDAESTLRALLVSSIASGIVFLVALRAWLRSECGDNSRRAAALFLAGSCGPFLILFTDVAEPPVAAAIAAAGLAYARACRDDSQHGARAAYGAIAAIAIASMIYQGVILALGMVPLVVSTKTITRRRLVLATGIAVLAVMMAMAAVEVGRGTSAIAAAATVVRGEHNPLMRSMMAAASPLKYAAAVLAGPPQGIVALDNYGGLRALQSSVGRGDRTAVVNVVLLLVGLLVTGVLFLRGVRDRQWSVLAAAVVLLALPVIRNQQYAYVKFYVLWPIPVALLALRCHSRTIFAAAAIVLAANGWLLTEQIRRGRENYSHARAAFASASPSTCWFTSGWTPPFAYLWPGSATPMLGTLGTGTEPDVQRAALTAALRRCFCESAAVWTDTTMRDGQVVRSVADHFEYSRIDFASVLIDPNEAGGNPVPGIWAYSAPARDRACRAVSR